MHIEQKGKVDFVVRVDLAGLRARFEFAVFVARHARPWWLAPLLFASVLLIRREPRRPRAGWRNVVGLVLIVLGVLFLSMPAHAQTLDPGKVQDGFATAPLATIAFLEAVAIVLLFRELRKETQGRLEDLARSYEAAMKLQESGVKLSIQALEAVEVVERVVERMPARST